MGTVELTCCTAKPVVSKTREGKGREARENKPVLVGETAKDQVG